MGSNGEISIMGLSLAIHLIWDTADKQDNADGVHASTHVDCKCLSRPQEMLKRRGDIRIDDGTTKQRKYQTRNMLHTSIYSQAARPQRCQLTNTTKKQTFDVGVIRCTRLYKPFGGRLATIVMDGLRHTRPHQPLGGRCPTSLWTYCRGKSIDH